MNKSSRSLSIVFLNLLLFSSIPYCIPIFDVHADTSQIITTSVIPITTTPIITTDLRQSFPEETVNDKISTKEDSSNIELWNIIISALIALGTVGAVIYALYRDLLKRPKLSVVLEEVKKEFQGAKNHFRILVQNDGNVTARNCMIQIEELIDFKSGISPTFYDSLSLEWRSPEIMPQSIHNNEIIYIESLQRKVDIPPKGNAKARFVVLTKDDKLFISYDVKNTTRGIELLQTDRSIFIDQWLPEPNSKIAMRIVVYADNNNPLSIYCIFKKDKDSELNLHFTTKRPKINLVLLFA